MQQVRRKLIATMLAAFALSAAAPIFAQNGPSGPRMNRVEFLAGYLSLTDAQKAQAKTIFDTAATASATAQGQLTAAHDALRAAIKINSSDSELERLSAAVGVIQGQLTAIEAKASAKFYALLTADQKTKYDAMGEHQGGPGRKGLRSSL